MCGMQLLIHSQTSTFAPLKFGNVQVISSHTLLDMWLRDYLSMMRIQLIYINKRDPGCIYAGTDFEWFQITFVNLNSALTVVITKYGHVVLTNDNNHGYWYHIHISVSLSKLRINVLEAVFTVHSTGVKHQSLILFIKISRLLGPATARHSPLKSYL